MQFKQPLVGGTLVRRYKRFLADVRLNSGEIITAHCTNSGSMLSCIEEGAPVYLSPAENPNRKTQFTWEMICISNSWVGVNTSNPNIFAYEALINGSIPSLGKWDKVVREVKFGDSRLDLYAERRQEQCYIEIKNVTLKNGKYARFPDALTTRGQKHLKELIKIRKLGFRSVILFIIQRTDVEFFAPAWSIDPEYGKLLVEAFETGVEIIPFQVLVTPQSIQPLRELPFNFTTEN
jgi:sugar fermentation stimulation protein A